MPSFTADPNEELTTVPLLASRGGNGSLDTANSLPSGFDVGTPAYNYAQSVDRYFANQVAPNRAVAAIPGRPHG